MHQAPHLLSLRRLLVLNLLVGWLLSLCVRVQRLTELQGAEKGTLRRAWKALDRDHLKPLLGGRQAAGAAGSAGNTQGTEYEPLASVGYDAARPTEVQLEGSHAEGLQPGSDPHWPDR